MKVLFIGCGDIAQRTANLLPNNYRSFGLKRNTSGLPSRIIPISADATSSQHFYSVVSEGFDIWIATLTPSEFTEQAYRDSYLAAAKTIATTVGSLDKPPKLVIWVSSTSVYGDCKSGWVDETSKVNPTTFSGTILLEAEQVINNLPCEHSIVRFSGIYGPGRSRMLGQVEAGKGRPEKPEQWSNRIHSRDCAGSLAHIIEIFSTGKSIASLYLASDSQPVTQHDLRNWLASQLSVNLAEEPVKMSSIRRCSNRLLLASGYRFIYPSYKEGYAQLINERQST